MADGKTAILQAAAVGRLAGTWGGSGGMNRELVAQTSVLDRRRPWPATALVNRRTLPSASPRKYSSPIGLIKIGYFVKLIANICLLSPSITYRLFD